MQSKRNSAHWMPDLVQIADDFYRDELNPKCVNYKKVNWGAINRTCEKMVDIVKGEMCPRNIPKSECLIDRYKIAAIHIFAFLKNRLFVDGAEPYKGSAADRLANERHCLIVLKVILEAWHEANGKTCALVIPFEREQELLKIFYKYGKSPLLNVRDTTFIYTLAALIYYTEKTHMIEAS